MRAHNNNPSEICSVVPLIHPPLLPPLLDFQSRALKKDENTLKSNITSFITLHPNYLFK